MTYLTINEQGVLELRTPRIVTGVAAVRDALQNTPDVLCSSSIDFPEEYTTDVETITFCESLQK